MGMGWAKRRPRRYVLSSKGLEPRPCCKIGRSPGRGGLSWLELTPYLSPPLVGLRAPTMPPPAPSRSSKFEDWKIGSSLFFSSLGYVKVGRRALWVLKRLLSGASNGARVICGVSQGFLCYGHGKLKLKLEAGMQHVNRGQGGSSKGTVPKTYNLIRIKPPSTLY
eukprot:scaffold17869_cov104-Isochrysis_galbana.AAC.2